ncbi:MAG: response regulator transcription factor [Sphingobacteriia bacterium]|nr:response regulator transcription factor [Sphingobacteriia bacterium]
MIRLAIVDDQQLFRESLSSLINSIPNTYVVQCFESAKNFQEFLLHEPAPDIVLLDLQMPEMNGMELNDFLHKKHPEIKVIILSVHDNERLISSLIRSGVDGYLTKNCDKQELLKAIHNVYDQGFYINKYTMQILQQKSLHKVSSYENINGIPFQLTKREIEVLQLICKEYSNSEIAAKLFLSIRTVEGHRNRLLQKIGCRNTAGLVLFAIKYQLHIDV